MSSGSGTGKFKLGHAVSALTSAASTPFRFNTSSSSSSGFEAAFMSADAQPAYSSKSVRTDASGASAEPLSYVVDEEKTPELLQLVAAALTAMDLPARVRSEILFKADYEWRNKSRLLLYDSSITQLKTVVALGERLLALEKPTRAAVKIQAMCRLWLVRRALKSPLLLPKRNEALLRLIRTERQYYAHLRTCVSSYLVPLRACVQATKSAVVSEADYAALSSNFEELASVHREVLQILLSVQQGWPVTEGRVGAAFLKIAPLLKVYEEYLLQFQHATGTVSRLEQGDAKFKAKLQSLDERIVGGAGLNLHGYLSLPLNRIPEYERLLQDVLTQTPEDHCDRQDLVEVCSIMDQTTKLVRGSLEGSDLNAVILDVLRRVQGLDKDVLMGGGKKRRLIKEGPVTVIGAKKLQTRHLFLFEDKIVSAKPFPKGVLKLRSVFDLQHCEVKDYRDESEKARPFCFQIVEGAETTIMFVGGLQDKSEWMAAITQQIEHCQASRVFAVDLDTVIMRDQGEVPIIVTKCAEHVLAHGCDVEGIFRLSGDSGQISKLRNEFNSGTDVDVAAYDVHVVAGVLKLWFRLLPSPLIPFGLYEDFMSIPQADRSADERKLMLKSAVCSLPPANLRVLQYLINFLVKLAAHSEVTKMTAQNLGIVFGPNVLRCREESIANTLRIPIANAIFAQLISHPELVK